MPGKAGNQLYMCVASDTGVVCVASPESSMFTAVRASLEASG